MADGAEARLIDTTITNTGSGDMSESSITQREESGLLSAIAAIPCLAASNAHEFTFVCCVAVGHMALTVGLLQVSRSIVGLMRPSRSTVAARSGWFAAA